MTKSSIHGRTELVERVLTYTHMKTEWLLYRGRKRGKPWHLTVSKRIEAKRVDGDKTLDSTIMKYLRVENDIKKEKQTRKFSHLTEKLRSNPNLVKENDRR